MKIRKKLIASLVLTILACIMTVLLSLVCLVAFSLVVSVIALTGESAPSWFSTILLLNMIVSVVAIVGAGVAFKFRRTGSIVLLVSAIFSIVLPISFWVLADFQLSAIGFVLMLLIPTILLVMATIFDFKVGKLGNHEEKNAEIKKGNV